TVKAVVGEKLVPGYIDARLGRDGYASQQTTEPASPDRRDNLWAPAPGNVGAHGRFDSQAKTSSVEWRLRRAAGPRFQWLKLAVAGVAGAALALSGRSDGARSRREKKSSEPNGPP